MQLEFLDLIYKTRENRQLYIHHGTVLKATLQKKASDDFVNSDPVHVLMECIGMCNHNLMQPKHLGEINVAYIRNISVPVPFLYRYLYTDKQHQTPPGSRTGPLMNSEAD